jgi:AcrR family transcriptional regulator
VVGCDDTAEPLHLTIGAVTPDTQYGAATPVVKRLRADARRNRDRLLAVAEDIFARRGLAASTDDIARAAGVGIGTLFRHFPTKEALLEAVFVARLQHLTEDAQRLSSGDDPGQAFATFFAQIITESRTKLPLATALAAAGVDLTHTAGDTKRAFNAALEQLLVRAQEAGAVRRDIGIRELLVLIVGASHAVQQIGDDRELEAQTVRIVLDGLAAGARRTAP